MVPPAKYRKLPVVIEAIRFDGSWQSAQPILEWIETYKKIDHSGPAWMDAVEGEHGPRLFVTTLEGRMTASPGDWIIRGVQGEFYPCKPDIFRDTYEPVDSESEDDA